MSFSGTGVQIHVLPVLDEPAYRLELKVYLLTRLLLRGRICALVH